MKIKFCKSIKFLCKKYSAFRYIFNTVELKKTFAICNLQNIAKHLQQLQCQTKRSSKKPYC